MAGGSPRRQAAATGRRRGTAGLCLLLSWLAAAAVLNWIGGRPRSQGLERSEELEHGRAAPTAGGNASPAAEGAVPPQARQKGATQGQPRHKFLIFFSGHQGSSALADMLAASPSVFVPGFEPLDFPGLSPAQKMDFLEAAFAFPASEQGWPAWRRALTPPVPGLRVDRVALRSFAQLEGKSVAGFKLRPYVLAEPSPAAAGGAGAASPSSGRGTDGGGDGDAAGGNSTRPGGHTALRGLSLTAVRELLHRRNVSVVLTLRRNAVKEAFSWHKARDLGVSQFNAIKAERTAAAAAAAGTAGAGAGAGAVRAVAAAAGAAGTAAGDAAGSQTGQEAAAGNGSVTVDIPRLLHWLNYTGAVNAELQRAVDYFGRPTLTIWYEDFLADPVREARRVAAFVGLPPGEAAALRPSAKFRKAGPDELQGAVGNFEELCRALEGTPHYRHLDAAACAARLSSSSGDSSGSDVGGTDGPPLLPPLQPGQPGLLDSWCLLHDKEASGWGTLSDAECMARFREQQAEGVAAVRGGAGTLLFKHVHKAGGTTLCRLAHLNMVAESAALPGRSDWDTNCAPYEAFLGPHPAVGGGGGGSADVAALALPQAGAAAGALSAQQQQRRRLQANWLGGACWLGFLQPPQLRALPAHFRPLTFVASEGPLPDTLPLDSWRQLAMVTMLRRPLDRVLSSYKWWQVMLKRMPQSPTECHAYSAPANATFEQWLSSHYPDNWMTRELVGRSALYDWRRRPLTAADLAAAQARLHLFAAVLILEEPASSMDALQRLFGWREVDWEAHRAGSRADSDAAAELAPSVLELLRRRNQLDLQLYEYARRLHAQQATAGGGARQ